MSIADGGLPDSEGGGRINSSLAGGVLGDRSHSAGTGETAGSSAGNLLTFKALFLAAVVKNSFYWGVCDLYRKQH